MREMHSRPCPEGRAYWWTDRLWALSAHLPVEVVAVASIVELDVDCWFDRQPATIRAVADHARRIHDADRSHPIILSADGALMDGGHRLAQAHLAGAATISARRFLVDPAPDWTEPDPPADQQSDASLGSGDPD